MTRPSTTLVAVLILSLSSTACAAGSRAKPASAGPAIELNRHRVSVEVAADDATRERGLMGRTSMPADHGMLFVFPDAEIRTFWMKDTLIPLDMLFFDDQRRLVTLLHDVPPCKANPCGVYASTAPARYVLELNAGAAVKFDVRDGDRATFKDVPSASQ